MLLIIVLIIVVWSLTLTLTIGINNFFHPYWKKGSDFVHYSRTANYAHLNKHITFTDSDVRAAAQAYPYLDSLDLMFDYDDGALQSVLSDDYWRPQKKKKKSKGAKKLKRKRARRDRDEL